MNNLSTDQEYALILSFKITLAVTIAILTLVVIVKLLNRYYLNLKMVKTERAKIKLESDNLPQI